MEAELQKSERGKDRLGKAKDRLDAKTAEMMEEMIDGPSRPKETRHPEANAPADDQPQGENHDSQQEDVIFEDDAEADVNDAKMRGRSSRGTQEVYIGTPDRPRKDKRRGEPDEMDDDDHKQRRFDDDQAMSIPGSPDDQPEFKHQKIDDDMLDSMDEVDRKILAASILGVDITEVYSPERIAKVARKFGLQAGSSFDLRNGWDFNVEEHRGKAWVKIKEESPYL